MTSRPFPRWRATTIARIATTTLSLLVAAPALAGQPPPRTPQPLDPLTAAERQSAETVARGDGRVKELLGGGRTRLVYVDFIAIKPGDASATPDSPTAPLAIGRHAEVVFYRYDDDSGVRAVVDLRKQAVVQAARIDSAEVPLNDTDLSEALALALKNEAVNTLLGPDASSFQVPGPAGRGRPSRNIVRALRVVASSDNDPCWKHRCVQLFFRRGDVYLTDSAVVDLTAQTSRVERGQR